MRSLPGRRSVVAVAFGLAAVCAIAPHTSAQAGPASCEKRNNNQYRKLLECVNGDGVAEHLAEFQAIAEANAVDGVPTRADQTAGYDASVAYVVDTMTAAGWAVDVVPFTYNAATVTLEQLTPIQQDLIAFDAVGTGEGDVNGNVIPVDINIAEGVGNNANSSGCDGAIVATNPGEDDFAGIDWSGENDIALIQRGTCGFADKARNAEEAGAEAVVLFNQGNLPSTPANDRFGPVNPTLAPFTVNIPVVGTTYAAGQSLAQTGATAHVVVDFFVASSENVIAELPGVNDNNVVMAGAHLDSVPEGPGINDNGSGSAALLEVAQNISNNKPQNTLRFAWWGAEEVGLLGSTAWVGQQSAEELARIAMYMNFDMVGSPNYIFMVYDADESSFPAPAGVPIPPGSAAIEDTFESYYTLAGVPYDDTEFSGRSDYQAFINNGIPSSGLFTGAEEVKTPEQADIWGGDAGQAFDQCYHQQCDDILNVDPVALDVNADAIAFAVLTYAYSTEAVNGEPGKSVPGKFAIPAPAGPQFTFVEDDGGAIAHHDFEAIAN
jgi:Zn-dependent M28 family amino/carboxypeptidase